jgi:hypothetical protein
MIAQTPFQISGHYLIGLDHTPLPTAITRLRHDFGLHHINPTAWYPAEAVLGFYAEVGADEAGAFDLVEIGRNITHSLPFPAHIHTLYDALAAAPNIHRAAWQGGDPGELAVRTLGERHVQMVFCDLPLPVDLVYGLCYGMIERFAPDTDDINVQRVARGRRYIFDLRW